MPHCLLCNADNLSIKEIESNIFRYQCSVCGPFILTRSCADDFKGEKLNILDRIKISTVLRNEYEKKGRKDPEKYLTLADLYSIVKNYRQLDPLEKINNA